PSGGPQSHGGHDMKSSVWMSLIAILFGGQGVAAPAPAPRTTAAEVAFSMSNEDGARFMARRFRSQPYLECVGLNTDVGKLISLKGQNDKAAWLAAHLEIDVVPVQQAGGQAILLRVRLLDCPANDAVALLNSIASGYQQQWCAELPSFEFLFVENGRRL